MPRVGWRCVWSVRHDGDGTTDGAQFVMIALLLIPALALLAVGWLCRDASKPVSQPRTDALALMVAERDVTLAELAGELEEQHDRMGARADECGYHDLEMRLAWARAIRITRILSRMAGVPSGNDLERLVSK